MSLTARFAEFHLTALGHARKHSQLAAQTLRFNPPTGWEEMDRVNQAEVQKDLDSAVRWERRAASVKADGTGDFLVLHNDDMELHQEHNHNALRAAAAECHRIVYEGDVADPRTTFASNPNAPRAGERLG